MSSVRLQKQIHNIHVLVDLGILSRDYASWSPSSTLDDASRVLEKYELVSHHLRSLLSSIALFEVSASAWPKPCPSPRDAVDILRNLETLCMDEMSVVGTCDKADRLGEESGVNGQFTVEIFW